MTTMLEKMAEAIYHSVGTICPLTANDAARAALQAIREPEGLPLGAAWSSLDRQDISTGELSEAFTAMIDAILNEPNSTT